MQTAVCNSLFFSAFSYNSLDGEVIDLLAGIRPEEFSVLSANLLQEKKINNKHAVNQLCPPISVDVKRGGKNEKKTH